MIELYGFEYGNYDDKIGDDDLVLVEVKYIVVQR